MKELAQNEAERLLICEGIIQQKMVDFLEVGTALLEIRDDKLYRNSHDTFEKYCHEKWSISRSRAYQLTNAVEVVKNLEMSTMVDKKNPINTSELKPERIIRPLTKLSKPKQKKAWNAAVKSARKAGHTVTASDVKEAVSKISPKPERPRREYNPYGNEPAESVLVSKPKRSLGQIAFDAYFKTFGMDCKPDWETERDLVKSSWEAAAKAVLAA